MRAGPGALKIKTPSGATCTTIDVDGASVRISAGSGDVAVSVRGRAAGPDARKYRDAAESEVLRVKPSRSGFRLEDAGGRLLWKVKLRPDRVKLAPAVDAEAPLAVRFASRWRVEATRDRLPAGKVRIYPDVALAKVKDAAGTVRYKIRTERLHPALGVLLFDEIPALERHAIVAELIARGR